ELIDPAPNQQDFDDSIAWAHRQYQQLSRHDRTQPRRPLCRDVERRLWHAGDHGDAVDWGARPENESAVGLSRQAFRRGSSSKLFSWPGLQLGWQASL